MNIVFLVLAVMSEFIYVWHYLGHNKKIYDDPAISFIVGILVGTLFTEGILLK